MENGEDRQLVCACGSALTSEEICYYGTSCNKCEEAFVMAMQNEAMSEEKLNGPQAAKRLREIAQHLILLADMLEIDDIHHDSGSMLVSYKNDALPDIISDDAVEWGVKPSLVCVTITADLVLMPGPQK